MTGQPSTTTRLLVDEVVPRVAKDRAFSAELEALMAPGRSVAERAASRVRLSLIAGAIAGEAAKVPPESQEQIGVLISRYFVNDAKWMADIQTTRPPPQDDGGKREEAPRAAPGNENPDVFEGAIMGTLVERFGRWGLAAAAFWIAINTNPFLAQLQNRAADDIYDSALTPEAKEREAAAHIPVRLSVTGDGLRVRLEPSIDATPVGALPFGTELPIHAFKNGWYLVEYRPPDGPPVRGWVWHDFVRVEYGPSITKVPQSLGPVVLSDWAPVQYLRDIQCVGELDEGGYRQFVGDMAEMVSFDQFKEALRKDLDKQNRNEET